MKGIFTRLGHVFWIFAIISLVAAIRDDWNAEWVAIAGIAAVLGYVCSGIPFRPFSD
jgi:hypothetical protein